MKLFETNGKISEIKLKNSLNTTAKLEEIVGGPLDFIKLLSDDILIVNINQEPGELNTLATTLAGKSVYGPVILSEPQEDI